MNPNIENMLLWEVIKNQIRGNTIQYSSIKKKAKNDKIKEIESTLYQLETQFNVNPNQNIKMLIDEKKQDLDKELEWKTKGAMIRSRARWSEEGEGQQNTS